jgi:hypothetical protein
VSEDNIMQVWQMVRILSSSMSGVLMWTICFVAGWKHLQWWGARHPSSGAGAASRLINCSTCHMMTSWHLICGKIVLFIM